MIFGKTTAEKTELRSQRELEKINGQRKMAFLPAQLVTGEYIWLSYYYEYVSGSIDDNCIGYITYGAPRRYMNPSKEYIILQDRRDLLPGLVRKV